MNKVRKRAALLIAGIFLVACSSGESAGTTTSSTSISATTSTSTSTTITTSTSTSTTLPFDSPYFSGILEITDELGWVYKVQIPEIDGLEFVLEKDVTTSPPGKAKYVVEVKYGNIEEIGISSGTPGRTPPDVHVSRVYLSKSPEVELKGSWIGDDGKEVFRGGRCHMESSDRDDATLEAFGASTPGSEFISGIFCAQSYDFDGTKYSPVEDLYAIDDVEFEESLIDETLGVFDEGVVGFALLLSNGCNISFDSLGGFSSFPSIYTDFGNWLTTEGATSTCTVASIETN